ncbi:trigger factor [Psychroserpens sp.]|uniref:trigger factor n=1 Tax=Psychroserpens sp. TaxID=2020870 RepID=UPI001B0FB4F0|nr:trigger factor [Psychroserpens sp.]MBO6607876.1 trigger factor [Psychroserpens sp.]MBO6654997.1 trigger factor [Psychroserpens sp.]MBO6682929.1 trigger factor [Psychroserpens sp.]MBO6751234.1 trigger factor [Psychroserpens sp.]MBO6916417.1 trigger factor [Psychroserpens sp.]
MNITRENIDALNAVVKVDIAKEDYSDKVEQILSDYRRSANIPGFRKGHVPMTLVKKQYGKAVLVDEVNKLLQDALGKYLTEEKLDVLGNPLPKPQDDLDWDADSFSFEFELGLAPEFEVNLKSKKAITHFNIIADDKMIDNQVEHIRKQYGKIISQTEVAKDSEITGEFVNEEAEINSTTTVALDKIKGKTNEKKFIGAKVGDVIALKTKNLFNEEIDLTTYLKVPREEAKGLNVEVSFTINEINTRELADLDQELFDKLFGPKVVTTVTELKNKIKEDSEKQFAQQGDQKLLNDVTEYLVENTKFDLPAEFLQKWMQTAGEEEMDADQAKEEYEKSEKSMRYQLIEGKIIEKFDLQVKFEDLQLHAKEMIKVQMAQFGQMDPSDEELDGIAARILSNKDEVKRLSEQLMSSKLLNLYKSEANIKTKEITYDDFVKEFYS